MTHSSEPLTHLSFLRSQWRSSVLLKQTAFVALVIVLTVGTLILSGHRFVRGIVTAQIDQRLVLAASDRQVLLQTYVRQQQERVALVASRTRLRQLIEEYAAGRMQGEVFRSESSRILVDAQRSSEGFLTISITDPVGKVITSTQEGELGKNYSTDPGFLEGRREKSLGLPRRMGEAYQAFLTAPVTTEDARFIGVAIVLLDVSPMVRFLTSTTGLGESGEVLVGTRDGNNVRLLLPTRHQQARELGSEGGAAMADAIGGQAGFVQTRDYRNVDVLAAYRPVGYRDWGLVAKIDIAEAYAPLAHLNTFILTLGAGFLLCGLIASYVLARRFTQPILDLADKAKTIASGDLRARAPIRSSDELGQLARAFNDMAETLQRQDEERRQTEQALRKSEEKFSKAFQASPDAVDITRLEDGLLVDVNPAAERFFGYSRAELIGKTSLALGLFANPADRERIVNLLRTEGHFRHFELQLRNRAGEVRDVLLSAERIEIAGTAHLISIIRDVTDLKRAEEDRLAKETAEQASRAKSEFLSRMSHELRTPLNAIIGFGQLMEMDAVTPEQRENVDHVLRAGRHLLNLINEILDIARIEAGRLSLSIEPVVLQEIVDECQDLIRPSIAQRRIVLDLQTDLDNQIVMADRQRLKQVLLNLLSNAVKFNPEGGRVTLSCTPRPQDRLRIAVTDTGPGISPESMRKLFTPFERLGAGQTGIEGTGLGLALSKTLTEAMEGVIGVESAVGRGSTFWIELPVAQDVAMEPDAREPAAATVGPAAVMSAPRTVLYIEDNLSNLKLLERVMARRPDVRLLTAMQGRLGLDLARQHHPDLILLDLDLPDVRGDQILRTLRDDPATRPIPVVMLTATATPGEIDRLLNSGASAYLTKPFDVKALFSLLDEIVAA
jgi:PAS domain S-box-containing protein